MASESPPTKKLASIVAIDMAGFSRRTETDEDGAIEALATLRERISNAAKAHGGRVFNTAGDGFMLEFPTASGALAASEEIASSEDPPVRIGVHLGEVSSTEAGDLLGHGVNVAARLQQMALPGGVLVSSDVKRAVRGSLGERLRPQGSVRLDKMNEVVPVFALVRTGGEPLKGRRRKIPVPAILIVSAVLVILALGAWAAKERSWTAPPASRIAILPFATLTSSPSSEAFARGLSDQLEGVLNANNMQTIAAEDASALRGSDRNRRMAQLGVKLLFDGEVKAEGGQLQVGIRLDDARQHVTLWTADLSGPADQPEALQAQAGARIVSVLTCAQRALKPAGGLSDPAAVALYLKACDLFVAAPGGSDDVRDNYRLIESLREVVAKAPGFTPARAALAKYLAWYAPRMPVARRAAFRTEAEQQARRVLAVDKTQPDAYLALERVQPWRDFAAREAFLDQALAADPNSSNANAFMAELLDETGRVKAGVDYVDHASAFDPFCLCSSSFFELAESGQTAAANAQLARFRRLYPDLAGLWVGALQVYWSEADWADYDALLKDRASWPQFFTSKDAALAHLLEDAVRSREPATLKSARDAVLADKTLSSGSKISDLARLGFVDDALKVADDYARGTLSVYTNTNFLFEADTASLRRDRRFMDLSSRLGLVAYWRATGNWPDFCIQPGLPYDCKTEAAKAAGQRT